MRRILITGAAGMLGRDLVKACGLAGLDTVALTHAELDIADAQAVETAMRAAAPDLAVNCAAWTDVDGAESAPDRALVVNGAGAGNVARSANGCGAWTIHISSDYVFDGSKAEPYVESDPTNPASAYGRSKLAGEMEVAENAPDRHTVVRSSWLFGLHGRCFPDTILRLASERQELSVVDDQVGCPTFTGHLAAGIVAVVQGAPPPGILHLAGAGSCSWFELATRVVELGGVQCRVTPARTEDMPRPAPRPAHSALVSERPDAPQLPNWHQGIEDYMAARTSAARHESEVGV
ncbi:MAG: dTDP-4-dehydrorhamnose reductase [Solirubrobacteraceae bacterium]